MFKLSQTEKDGLIGEVIMGIGRGIVHVGNSIMFKGERKDTVIPEEVESVIDVTPNREKEDDNKFEFYEE